MNSTQPQEGRSASWKRRFQKTEPGEVVSFLQLLHCAIYINVYCMLILFTLIPEFSLILQDMDKKVHPKKNFN